MAADLQIVFEEPEFTVATCENSILWCFRGEVSLPRVKQAQPLHRQLVRRHPKGFAVCTMITEAAPLAMPSDARALSASVTKEFQPYYCALCEVVIGSGFRASIVRSITGSFRLLARATCPAKVFAETDPCAEWLAPIMSKASGAPVDVEALKAAARRVHLGRS
jgi:hypothetical protein